MTKKMKKKKNKKFVFLSDLKESKFNLDDNVIENVVILSQKSLNGRYYSDEVQMGSLGLFENMKCFKDHSYDLSRKIDDLIGKYSNISFNKANHKTYGDLHLIENTNIAAKLKEIAKTMPDVAGISVHISAKYHLDEIGNEIIDEIVKAHSGDLVIEPATTKGLFENINEKESDMEIKDITLAWVREQKPSILSPLNREISDLKESNKSLKELIDETKDLEETNKSLKDENDKIKSEISKQNKIILIDKKLKESKLPSKIITESFKKTLLSASEDEIGDVIKDLSVSVKESGVKFNHEKVNEDEVKLNDSSFISAMKGAQ